MGERWSCCTVETMPPHLLRCSNPLFQLVSNGLIFVALYCFHVCRRRRAHLCDHKRHKNWKESDYLIRTSIFRSRVMGNKKHVNMFSSILLSFVFCSHCDDVPPVTLILWPLHMSKCKRGKEIRLMVSTHEDMAQ